MWLVLWQARVKDSRAGQKVPANLRPSQIELEYFPVLSCLGKLSGGLWFGRYEDVSPEAKSLPFGAHDKPPPQPSPRPSTRLSVQQRTPLRP